MTSILPAIPLYPSSISLSLVVDEISILLSLKVGTFNIQRSSIRIFRIFVIASLSRHPCSLLYGGGHHITFHVFVQVVNSTECCHKVDVVCMLLFSEKSVFFIRGLQIQSLGTLRPARGRVKKTFFFFMYHFPLYFSTSQLPYDISSHYAVTTEHSLFVS